MYVYDIIFCLGADHTFATLLTKKLSRRNFKPKCVGDL